MEIFQLFQDIISFDEQGKLSIRYDNELSQVWVRLPVPPTKYLVLYIAVAGVSTCMDLNILTAESG
jgi:hypothetical protein